MELRRVEFFSDGFKLQGVLHLPERASSADSSLPIVIVNHGRFAIKEWVPSFWIPHLLELGFAAFAFDYRNLGESEGTPGRIIPQEEVRDLIHAVTAVQQQPEIDPERIGVLGWGLGGGVAVVAAARDDRIKAVACASGLVDGELYARSNMTPTQWRARQVEIEQDRIARVLTGKSKMLTWDSPGPDAYHPADPGYGWRDSLAAAVGVERAADPDRLGIPSQISLESMEALYTFSPISVVEKIGLRPLLVVHAIDDASFPYDDAVSMYRRAMEPKTLISIPASDHLRWIDPQFAEQATYVPQVARWFEEKLISRG